ncbi:protein phosphatase 1 regulatory subunit 15A [Suricata suricatta]|uniref:Protein phosphatase 1 regulatory subunit 15A n=1 Tax=Suricata suricatta TaxID=37032 RepID=A0A673V9W6_SURSU|nr:protein phosphatase 1 regulatory subunit 15A [Suricata suricatta]XP_029781666.1 protein phosphatase 1 regulatory subunit 15A [Suricata suricatta]
MAPGQAPHQSAPWRGSHPFFLLSPLMGLLSKAWSHLRGPGPPEPWLLDPVARADQGEAGPEGKAKTFLATHRAPEGRHFPAETGDGGAAEKDGEGFWGASHDLKASHDLEAWGLSDGDDEEDGGEQTTTCVPQEQGSEFVRGRPAPRSPSLLVRTLQGPPGEEKSEGGAAAEDEMVTFFSFPPSLWECCPGEEAEEGEAINKEAARTPTFPLSPGSKPKAWGYWAGEEGDQATEEKKTENNKATKSAVSPSSSGVHPRAWECGSGEESEEEEDEFNDSGAAEEEGEAGSPSSIPPTSAFIRAWVYRPGEDTEEEEEEEEEEFSDSGEAESLSSVPPTSAFIRAWVYRPGEDTEEDEDSDLGAAEEEGEAESSFSVPATGTFLRAWVYRPGEDTEEEDENEEEDDSETTDSAPSPSLQAQSALLGSGIYRSGEDTEGREVAKSRGEAEPRPLRVAIYLPGERPPPAWAPPRLPVRLQRRLKSTETPTRRPDPESPGKARKVHFSEKVSVHLLAVWAGPAQAARRGPWEQLARDRSRFARRIAQAQEQLGPCLTPAARARAWARFKDPTPPLATTPPPTQILPSSSIQSTPLSPVRASPFDPPSPSPGLDLSGRRG